jgi:hypothetical protein
MSAEKRHCKEPGQATGMPQLIPNPELPLSIPGVTKKKILGKYLHTLKIYRKIYGLNVCGKTALRGTQASNGNASIHPEPGTPIVYSGRNQKKILGKYLHNFKNIP